MSDQLIPPAIIHAPSSDFPSDVLKWIKENAEGKMALKSMKCHKYFQHPEFPYSIILNIAYNDRADKWDVMTLDGKKHVYYGLESIETAFTKKLWLIGSLALLESPNLVTRFITKIAVCDIKYLTLADQQFSFNDFLFLTSANLITHISLYNTVINDDNGDPIFIDSILKCLPNLTAFICSNFDLPIISIDFINTYQSFDTSKLKAMNLQMPSFIEFLLFTKFMDKNPHIHYDIEFIANSLSAKETETVKNYVENIIDAGVTENPPPSIEFPGQSDEQSKALFLLFSNYNKQKNPHLI